MTLISVWLEAEEITLPAEYRLRIRATSGEYEVSKEITIRLLPVKWLIMYYVDLDTEPDIQMDVEKNILEILNVTRIQNSPKIRIIALVDLRGMWFYQLGFAPEWLKIPFTMTGDNAYLLELDKLEGKKLRLISDWGPKDMGNPDTLLSFVKYCTFIPAEHTQLIISDHGDGMAGIAWDHHQGGHLEISKIAEALKDYRFDIISFEACLMGQFEVVHPLRSLADYFTCSELTMFTLGYNYEAFLPDLLNNPDMAAIDYARRIHEKFGEEWPKIKSMTHSIVNSSKLDDLASALDNFAKTLIKGYKAKDGVFNRTVLNAARKTVRADYGRPYIDILDFAKKIRDSGIEDLEINEAASRVIDEVNKAVIATKAEVYEVDENMYIKNLESPGYGGLTIFMWDRGVAGKAGEIYKFYLENFKQTNFARDTDWKEFVENLLNSEPSNMITLALSHPGHELYLHVYDEWGRHLGFNPSNGGFKKVDTQIKGAFYMDFQNGTEIILLPSEIGKFRTVVDGNYMEEAEEPYTLNCSLTLNNEISITNTIQKVILKNTTHSTPMKIEGNKLVVSETTVVDAKELEKPQRGPLGEFTTLSIIVGCVMALSILALLGVYTRARRG